MILPTEPTRIRWSLVHFDKFTFYFCRSKIFLLSVTGIAILGMNNHVQAQNKKFEAEPQATVEVEKIEFEGNTVFSDSELKKAVNLSSVEKVSLERLIQIRTQVSDYYVKKGYLSSGAFLPSQEITDRKVSIHIVEGSLERIDIEGLSHLNHRYIVSRLPALEKPLKTSDLARALTKLREDPLIENLQAYMKPISPGKYLLTVEIESSNPLSSQFVLNNNYSPSVGTLGGTINANYYLFGLGDSLGLGYTKTEGLTRYDASYLFPVNKYNGIIELRYANADTKLVEDPVSALDIQADFETFSLSMKQPITLDEKSELALVVEFELIESETFVDRDFSFAFVDGLSNGKSNISALRLTQEYFNREETNSLALRSQFNVGINIFDPTVTEVGIDGLFWSWQGQGQWLKKLDNFLLVSSLNMQFTGDKLLPIEQLSLGGANSVKGYRQNLSIGDNGIVGSVELQMPLIQSSRWESNLIPFIDAGTLWNNSSEDLSFSTLASVGLGFNFALGDMVDARIDYGIPLIEAEAPEDFSTEERINFRLLFQP